MSIEDFNKALGEFEKGYYAREEGELFLVYKDTSPVDEFVGSCYADDVEEYGIEDTLREFGIY